MGYHHLALATRDMKAIDHFYREVMGFDLKKVEVGPTPDGGWAKHFFYEIEPDRFIAFWELHGPNYDGKNFETGLSKAVGLPPRCRWPSTMARARKGSSTSSSGRSVRQRA